jgi:hypothetical protein
LNALSSAHMSLCPVQFTLLLGRAIRHAGKRRDALLALQRRHGAPDLRIGVFGYQPFQLERTRRIAAARSACAVAATCSVGNSSPCRAPLPR